MTAFTVEQALPVIFMALMGVSMLIYVVSDGYDLGVGMLMHRATPAEKDTLVASIRMLVDTFPPETVVYPGHGPTTTLGAELARNPFLAELRTERAG